MELAPDNVAAWAEACLALGQLCQAFEFQPNQGFCEFKLVTSMMGEGLFENE